MLIVPRFATLVVAALLAAPLRAHDPAESWTEAIVHPDQLELLVTMAQVTALKLIDPAGKIAQLTPENFAQHRARLVQAGAVLFTITSVKTQVAARRVDVQLTEENDVAFRIIFPRPAAGVLMFEATFIKKLGNGIGGVIDASDTEGHEFGWEQLTPENTTLVVTLPKPGELPPRNK